MHFYGLLRNYKRRFGVSMGSAIILFAYGMILNVRSYENMSVGAVGIQLFVAVFQVFIVSLAVVMIIIRKFVKRKSGEMRMILDWTKHIWNI